MGRRSSRISGEVVCGSLSRTCAAPVACSHMTDDPVLSAVDDVVAADPSLAHAAEVVMRWVEAAGGLHEIGLATVERLVWYELPYKWMGPPEEVAEIVRVAGEVMERVGESRYAEVCRSQQTRAILDAYAMSTTDGFEAFEKAFGASGIDPPDLDDFAWGDMMGMEEVEAARLTSRELEAAMAAGRFAPGRSGWKTAAREVTTEALDAVRPELLGQTYRDVILTERIELWLHRSEGSKKLHALRSHNANRLLHPIPPPADVSERLEPIRWFLETIDADVRLTAAGYLPPAVVREAADHFEWSLGWTDRPPRSQAELQQLMEIDELVSRIGAVRRRGKTLKLTERGRRMLADDVVAWREVAAGFSEAGWLRAVAEVFTYLLVDGERPEVEMEQVAASVLSPNWRHGENRPDHHAVGSAWWRTRSPLEVLGGIIAHGPWHAPTLRLTDFGEATLLEQIRVMATGPQLFSE